MYLIPPKDLIYIYEKKIKNTNKEKLYKKKGFWVYVCVFFLVNHIFSFMHKLKINILVKLIRN